MPRELLGPQELSPKAERASPRLHPAILQQCTELPNVGDSEVVQAFLSGTSCRDLVQELGRNISTSVDALLDIATNFASGEEAVEAIFPDNNAKGKRRDKAPGASAPHLPKKKKNGH